MKKITYIFVFLAIFGGLAYFFNGHIFLKNLFAKYNQVKNSEITSIEAAKAERNDRLLNLEIKEGSTYGQLMEQASTSPKLANEIYETAKPIYDLVKIRQGKNLELIFDKDTEELKELIYKIDSEDELRIIRKNKEISLATEEGQTYWQAEIIPIPYEVKIKTSGGEVKSSMYQAAIDNNIDIRAIIELADAFEYTIDFAMDPRSGDTFRLIYEERYLDGQYIAPGKVLAGEYVNDGKKFEIYYFEESVDNKGFFDEKGNSAQTMFLKAPVSFKYISSGYTTGPRYVSAFKQYNSSHMAIDYAAAYGTPIRTVGNGTVTSAGRKSGYGNSITIRHNETYTTTYSHLSKFAIKRGEHVSQGQIIGYVGSTGYSTGPHLHFEMIKNGYKINPLKEILPPGKPIKDENKTRFFEEIKKYQAMLQ